MRARAESRTVSRVSAPKPEPEAAHAPRVSPLHALRAYRNRGWVQVLVGLAIASFALLRARDASESPVLGIALSSFGSAAFLAYVALRIWATLYVAGNKDRALQTAGPYSLCRNPLYLANLCLGIAIAGALESLAFAAAVGVAAALYVPLVIRPEEALLEQRFGAAYREYCESTPRLWPRLSGFRSTAVVSVDMARLGNETRRLARAAAAILVLEALFRLVSHVR
jgi:protein-S-isoprenylcysteine O-methyltransferase Ste14